MTKNDPLGDGRDPQTGRFVKGWKGGPGNPHGATAARFRAVLMEAVSEDDLRAVAAELVARAKAGERWAVKELLDRTAGRPAVAESVDAPEPVVKVFYGVREEDL